MSVELRDFRWAITASQHRSLRQAAETLNVRQSTLSRRLRDLEDRLGMALFERSNGGTQLTATGQEFLKAARRIVAEAEAAFFRLSAYGKGETGKLSIGVYTALSTGNLRATLQEYRRLFPDVSIRLVDGACTSLLSDLAADSLDIVILTAGCTNWGECVLPLWQERVIVALPESHLLCAKEAIQWSELKSEPLLVNRRDPGPEFHRLLMTKLGCRELCHSTEHDVGIDRLLSLVGAGLGLTLVLEGATGAAYPGVAFREIRDDGGPTRSGFIACWRKGSSNPTLQPFLALLRERYPDISAPGRVAKA